MNTPNTPEQQILFGNPNPQKPQNFYNEEDPTGIGKKPTSRVRVVKGSIRIDTTQPSSQYPQPDGYWKNPDNATPRGPGTKE